MFDLNDVEQLEKLDKAARSDQGQLILNYLKVKLSDFNAQIEAIDLTIEDKLIGQEYRRLATSKRALENIINFLILRYENSSQK